MKWFTECLKSASRVTVGNHDMINVLDSLNNDLKALPRLRRQLSAEVALSTDSPVDEHGWFFMDWSVSGRGILFIYDDLLPLATRYGVTDYVRANAQSWARYYSPHNPYASNWARLLKFVFGHPIPAYRDRRGCFQTSLYPNACLVDPPSPEMFKALLGCHGAAGKLASVLSNPIMSPVTHATARIDRVRLYGLSVLGVIVGVALISSVARKTASAASQAWSQWVPVLRLFTMSYGQRLDIRLAKAVTEQCQHFPTGRRPNWRKTYLAAEDLVRILETDCTESNFIDNWRIIIKNISHNYRTTRMIVLVIRAQRSGSGLGGGGLGGERGYE